MLKSWLDLEVPVECGGRLIHYLESTDITLYICYQAYQKYCIVCRFYQRRLLPHVRPSLRIIVWYVRHVLEKSLKGSFKWIAGNVLIHNRVFVEVGLRNVWTNYCWCSNLCIKWGVEKLLFVCLILKMLIDKRKWWNRLYYKLLTFERKQDSEDQSRSFSFHFQLQK